MKKQLSVTCAFGVTCLFLLSALVSCSVDERYDTTKKIDATIGVGKGLALPLGSTQKFCIEELIDTAGNDFLEIDEFGNIVISAGDSFVSDSFKIDETSLNFTIKEDIRPYDFKTELQSADNIPADFPINKYPYIVSDTIDFQVELDITEDDLPKEVKRLTKLTFREPVEMSLFVSIYSKSSYSHNLLKTTQKLQLQGDFEQNKENFEIDLPDFLVFDEDTRFEDGVLKLEGWAVYDEKYDALCYNRVFNVVAIDFTKTEKGYLEIEDGAVNFNEIIRAHGLVVSDIVEFDLRNLKNINGVEIKSKLEVGELKLATVEGLFEPEIDPVTEIVELNISDIDFLKNAYIDVTDPRLALTFNNGLDATILADATIIGYDENYAEIENSRIDVNLEVQPAAVTNILVDRYGKEHPGWTNCVVPNLNELIKNIPDKLSVDLNVRLDETKTQRITLGEELSIGGSYELQLPLAFDSLGIEYTYSMENVLGGGVEEESGGVNDSTMPDYSYYGYSDSGVYDDDYYYEDAESADEKEIADIVKEIRGVSLSFKVLNTIPVGLKPSISVYDKEGNPLDALISIEGEIKRGGELRLDDYGYIGEPVVSDVKVSLSAKSGLLDQLYRVDIKLVGTGKGVINAREYIQLTDIVFRIDDYIVLDLNNN